jgi:hypothetical protein
MLEWESMNGWFLGRICFHRVSPVRVQMDILLDRAAQTQGPSLPERARHGPAGAR